MNPTKNHSFNVFFFDDVEVDGVLHDGVNIMLPSIQVEDYRSGLYHASIVAGNQIAITVPSASFPFTSETDFQGFYRMLSGMGIAGVDRLQLVHSVCRTSLGDTQDGLVQRILLQFPEDCCLTQGIWRKDPKERLHSEMDAKSIDSAIVPFLTMDNTATFGLSWIVEHIVETSSMRKTKQQIGKSHQQHLADLLASMQDHSLNSS